jgi:thiol-disulfide isomerase/thioredoxin
MRRMLFICGLLAAVCLPLGADDTKKQDEKGPPAKQVLAEAVAKAKKDDKRVFLMFGSPTCGWCKYLDKYHADPSVKELLDKHVVLVKVDVVTNPGGEEMYKKYGTDRGVPAFSILDADEKVLGDSGDGKDNVGFPYEPHEIAHYAKVMKKACPKLTDADVEMLTAKLKEIGPKKDKQ